MSTTPQTVLITGGSSGIGAALALRAAGCGWRALIGYATGRDRAVALASEIASAGGEAMPVSLPLTDAARIAAACDELSAEGFVPDALVLSAAHGPIVKPFAKLTPEDFRDDFEVGVIGNHRLISHAWKKFFRRRGGGHIVGVLSTALGPPAAPHMASYVAGKAALKGLLMSACAEFGRAGLSVSAISPGYTETPMLGCFDTLMLERERSRRPFLTPDAVADRILACLADPPPAGELFDVPVMVTA